ncbi:MAG: mycothiol system anti-sigma-R factor [Chloroflexi bacterium]|nr:mycothiol system anti-sigma-R factor [Chloroflexota bacterium]
MNKHNGVRMIDCKEAERRMHRYLDRELSDHEITEVQQHLEACENCRMRFRFEAGLRRLVNNAAQSDSAPPSLRERIRRLWPTTRT